jgi:hypothetical protein
MIKNNELRIGNIVGVPYPKNINLETMQPGLESAIVESIRKDQISLVGFEYPKTSWVNMTFHEPVPLTEKWLLRFGAEKYETPHDNQYRIGNRLFVIRNGKIVDYGTSVILDFVHRFQNFMYELTNEELKYEI